MSESSELNEEQQNYYSAIIRSIEDNHKDGAFDENFLLITGKAGTGKSYLASHLVKYFQDNPISHHKLQCTALTHKALNELRKKLKGAKVDLEGLNGISTVHSYFNIKATINYKTGVEEFKVQLPGKKPNKSSILFIDEVSMLDEELFKLIRAQSHLYESVVMIGDEFQVPPVNDSKYNLFQDPAIQKFKLQNIVRQAADNPIIQLASEIVERIENKDYNNKSFCIQKAIEYSKYHQIITVNNSQDFVKEYYEYVREDLGKPILDSRFYNSFFTTFTNATVDALNYVAKCIYRQSNKINYLDIGDLLVLQTPAFDPYLSDQIIMQNNSELYVHDLEEDTYEGIPIYIVHSDETFIRVVKPESLDMFERKLEEYSQKAKIDGRLWKQYFDFKKKFTEIKQCFACTTHKAQGSTVDRVFVDFKDLPFVNDTDLAFRLAYVGVTRTSDTAVIKY